MTNTEPALYESYRFGGTYNARDIRKLLDIHGDKFPTLNLLPLDTIDWLLYYASQYGVVVDPAEDTGILDALDVVNHEIGDQLP